MNAIWSISDIGVRPRAHRNNRAKPFIRTHTHSLTYRWWPIYQQNENPSDRMSKRYGQHLHIFHANVGNTIATHLADREMSIIWSASRATALLCHLSITVRLSRQSHFHTERAMQTTTTLDDSSVRRYLIREGMGEGGCWDNNPGKMATVHN